MEDAHVSNHSGAVLAVVAVVADGGEYLVEVELANVLVQVDGAWMEHGSKVERFERRRR